MSDRIIKLQPFPTVQTLPNIEIITTISRSNQQLQINYFLQGDLEQIILPVTHNQVFRKDGLWESTCFEFFLAIFNSPQYWEFNLAPTGDWNSYRFTNYRRGMITEKVFNNLSFKVQRNKTTYEMAVKIDLKKIIAGDTLIEIAITTVIEDINHNLSYWAITHPGTKADFHRRDSFITI